MASFAFNWNTITFSESGGVLTATINLEGTAEGFGTVLGTLSAHGAGTPSGTYDLLAVSFPESGEQVIARGSGEWTQAAGDRWTSSGTADLSTGENVKAEGEFLLGERTWSGTFG
jgi:hypothetical protein